MPETDVAVVGAGPAGLAAALAAARAGGRVLCLERQPEAGRKLAASGGGRGNLANARPEEELAAAFGRHGRFTLPAFGRLPLASLRACLVGIGIETRLVDGLNLYPESERAADVRDAFVAALRREGVACRFGPDHAVMALTPDGEARRGFLVETASARHRARTVVLAAGGMARPDLGGTRAGLDLASAAGHGLREGVPALVPLRVAETWPKTLAGLSVPEVTIRMEAKGRAASETRGALLFTHRGLSGPAVLDLSAAVADRLAGAGPVRLRVGFLPGVSPSEALARLESRRRSDGARTAVSLLRTLLPNRLAEALARETETAETRLAELSAPAARLLAEQLAGCPLRVSGTEGFRTAMGMRGGVRLKEVRPETLESRRVPGCFFAGEILDLDGPCGGYHLHWAFASGTLAGEAAARSAGGPAPAGGESDCPRPPGTV